MLFKLKNITGILLFAILLGIVYNYAQTREFAIKAALIEKFSNYIDWPAQSDLNNSPKISVGIIGESDFGEALKDIFKDVRLKDKEVEVFELTANLNRLPNIIILGKLEQNIFNSLLNLVKNKPILLITDIEKYASSGPHINFYFTEEGSIRFKFNKKTFDESGLFVSHHLLRYAEFVE